MTTAGLPLALPTSFGTTRWERTGDEEDKLIASDDDAGDLFGQSVSVSGNVIIVGAFLDDEEGSAAGAAYHFRFNGTDWDEHEKLTASDAATADQFGFAVAVSGDHAFIGAAQEGSGPSVAGSAYPFRGLAGPEIVHADGLSGETRPFSGYIDPRRESDDGNTLDEGLDDITIVFSEKVYNIGGADLTAASFSVSETGGGGAPTVDSISSADDITVTVNFSRILTLEEWTTITADVENGCGTPITTLGSLGSADEPDRVDVGFLPGDVDQSGDVYRTDDLARWLAIYYDTYDPPQGTDEDYLDTNRNSSINPLDLTALNQLFYGTGNATKVWEGETISTRP